MMGGADVCLPGRMANKFPIWSKCVLHPMELACFKNQSRIAPSASLRDNRAIPVSVGLLEDCQGLLRQGTAVTNLPYRCAWPNSHPSCMHLINRFWLTVRDEKKSSRPSYLFGSSFALLVSLMMTKATIGRQLDDNKENQNPLRAIPPTVKLVSVNSNVQKAS